MLFHAFRVVYTVKELDSHAKHGQSFKKKIWTYSITEYFCAKNLTPGRTCPCTHRPEWERERAHQRASIGRLAARDSLGKNVSKEECFWLWGKDNLVQLPKTTHHYVNSGYSFSGAAMEFLKCFVDERFINKAQFDAGFAHRLILKDGAVPAIKDPGHDSELQMVSETASNVSVLLAIGAQVLVTL